VDPLAHTLVGAALARTRLARGVPLATTTLVAAANLPDVDVLAYVGGEDTALAFRRGVTHGPLGFALLPLVLVALVALATRRRRARGEPVPLGRIAALAYLGALTHPLLDLLNVYGVRLLAPFSGRWFYGDVLFIVDPWFWLILGIAVFLVREPTRPALALWLAAAGGATYLLLTRPLPPWANWLWCAALAVTLVARWLLREPLRRRRESVAAAALALWLAYLGGMASAALVARRQVAAELARRGVPPIERSMVAPVAVDPRPRDVVVELAEGYLFGDYSLATGELRLASTLEPAPPATPEVRAALADPAVRGFLGWARFPFVRVERAGDATRVHLLDGRYVRELPRSGRRFGVATIELRSPAPPPGAPVNPPAGRDP
jgi:inner membrane protein